MKRLFGFLKKVTKSTFEYKHVAKKYFGSIDFHNFGSISLDIQRPKLSNKLLIDFVPYQEITAEEFRQIDSCKNREEREIVYLNLPEDAYAVEFHKAIRFGLQYAFNVYKSEIPIKKSINVRVTDVVRNMITNDELMAYISAQALWKGLEFTPSEPIKFDKDKEEFSYNFQHTPYEPSWRKPKPYYASTENLTSKLSIKEAISMIQALPTFRRFASFDHKGYTYYEDVGFGWLFTSDIFYDKTLFLESLMGTFDLCNHFSVKRTPSEHILIDRFTGKMEELPPFSNIDDFLASYRKANGYH